MRKNPSPTFPFSHTKKQTVLFETTVILKKHKGFPLCSMRLIKRRQSIFQPLPSYKHRPECVRNCHVAFALISVTGKFHLLIRMIFIYLLSKY